MKKIVLKILLVTATFLPIISLCQQKDSIFLYNGQVLIGDIKGAQLGIITIDDVDLKLIDVKLYKIKRLKTAQRFRIETNERQIYYGSLDESSKYGWADIELADGEKIPVEITDISILIFLEKNFFKRLDGSLGAGFSFTKSKSIGQTNLNATVSYSTKSFDNQLRVSAIGSIDSSKYSRDNENIELFSTYNLNSSWFIAGLAAYQRNLELSIARRFQEMAGAGNKIFLRKDWQLLVISGLTFNQEKSTNGTSSELLLEIPVMLRFNFFKFQHPNIQIGSTQTIYLSITENGRVRYSGSTDFAWELVHNFSFTLNLYNNYDNKPPSSSTSNIDYGMVAGISYKF